MPSLKTTVDKALHQVRRGRRRITDPADCGSPDCPYCAVRRSERLPGISIQDEIKWRYGSPR